LEEAQQLALVAGVDLVELVPDAEPPVCRLMDYGKFRFQQKKKLHDQRKKQRQVHIKEIKFRPGTEEGDYQVKLRKLTEFIEIGDRVKVTVRFRGREMAHMELGTQLLQRVAEDTKEFTTVDQFPQSAVGRAPDDDVTGAEKTLANLCWPLPKDASPASRAY
jgi:translation initiation factor IF-3